MILLSVFIIFLNGFVMLIHAESPSSNNGQQRLTAQYGEVPEVNNLLKKKSVESSLKNLKVTNHASNEISTNGKTITNTSRTEVLNEIPEILFSDVPHHRKLLLLLLQHFQRGNHLLLVDNRGLENKKVADRLLQHLNCFTEYTQLHSAMTIKSLTVQPNVKNGTVIYEDSPLVRAVKYGYVLVVDEANKAPTTVTMALNTLMEGREMLLSDGRMMIPKEIMNTRSSENKSAGFIPVHEDFRMIIMASQTGFPFFKKDSSTSSDLEARYVRRASVLLPPGDLSRRRRFVGLSKITASRNGEIGVTVKAVGSSPKIITTVMGGHSTGPYSATAVATGTAVATATALTYDKGSSTATATASGSSVANAIAYSRDAGVATATVTTSGSSVGDAIADAYNTGGATATITCTGSSNSGAVARAQDSGVATATATTSASASLNVRAMARGNEVITDTKTKP